MAEGKPVGQMYVELSLDATKYTKAQKEILAGAEKNSADINKAFKTVGTKTDEMYNAMRKNIQNHLDAIKKSHLSSHDEIRRAKESAAAKIKAIDEAQYGVQTGLIEKWKKNWLAATAAVTAAYFAVSRAWDIAEKAANYQAALQLLQRQLLPPAPGYRCAGAPVPPPPAPPSAAVSLTACRLLLGNVTVVGSAEGVRVYANAAACRFYLVRSDCTGFCGA